MAQLKVHLDVPVAQFLQPPTVTLRNNLTVDQAIAFLREIKTRPEQQVVYFYVLSSDDTLVGVVASRKLLLSAGSTRLDELMSRGVIFLRQTDTLMEACELFAMHRLLAIPVVDKQQKFLGTIDVSVYTDEVFDLAEKKASDSLFQLIGLHLEQVRNAPILRSYKLRMPWLLANIAGGLACAVLASLFDHVLREIILLAVFIPIMLTLAEAVAIQSMTLTVQTIAAGGGTRLIRGTWRELLIAALLGVSSAVLVTLVAWLWPYPRTVAVVIGASIVCNICIAAIVGNLVPKLIMRFRLNPTVASGPMVLAFTDIAAITVYLSAATLILSRS